ncbi:hypothetical protein pb186bvf_021198 [Paramecium bursaria]
MHKAVILLNYQRQIKQHNCTLVFCYQLPQSKVNSLCYELIKLLKKNSINHLSSELDCKKQSQTSRVNILNSYRHSSGEVNRLILKIRLTIVKKLIEQLPLIRTQQMILTTQKDIYINNYIILYHNKNQGLDLAIWDKKQVIIKNDYLDYIDQLYRIQKKFTKAIIGEKLQKYSLFTFLEYKNRYKPQGIMQQILINNIKIFSMDEELLMVYQRCIQNKVSVISHFKLNNKMIMEVFQSGFERNSDQRTNLGSKYSQGGQFDQDSIYIKQGTAISEPLIGISINEHQQIEQETKEISI